MLAPSGRKSYRCVFSSNKDMEVMSELHKALLYFISKTLGIKRMWNAVILVVCLLLCTCSSIYGSVPNIEIVDTPTTEVLDNETLNISLRIYQNGGVLTKFLFSITHRINIGLSIDCDNIIGKEKIDVHQPQMQVKVRFFDGNMYFPSLLFGYDSQGYVYDSSTGKYTTPQKGLYLVGTKEIFLPGLELHAGINIYDFEKDTLYSFLGWTLKLLNDKLIILSEIDNIRNISEVRVNIGLRMSVAQNLAVEISTRNINRTSNMVERILRLYYVFSWKRG